MVAVVTGTSSGNGGMIQDGPPRLNWEHPAGSGRSARDGPPDSRELREGKVKLLRLLLLTALLLLPAAGNFGPPASSPSQRFG
jgi:hypothetical protein